MTKPTASPVGISRRVTTADGVRLHLWDDGDVTAPGARVVGRVTGPARLWVGDLELFPFAWLPDWIRIARKSSTPGEARDRLHEKILRQRVDGDEWRTKFCHANGIRVGVSHG